VDAFARDEFPEPDDRPRSARRRPHNTIDRLFDELVGIMEEAVRAR
jgi:hypothetical protein